MVSKLTLRACEVRQVLSKHKNSDRMCTKCLERDHFMRRIGQTDQPSTKEIMAACVNKHIHNKYKNSTN